MRRWRQESKLQINQDELKTLEVICSLAPKTKDNAEPLENMEVEVPIEKVNEIMIEKFDDKRTQIHLKELFGIALSIVGIFLISTLEGEISLFLFILISFCNEDCRVVPPRNDY